MRTDVHILNTLEECDLLRMVALQSGVKVISNDFVVVAKKIMDDDLGFIRAIEKNPQAALALYDLTSAEIEFIRGFVLSRADFEKQVYRSYIKKAKTTAQFEN